MEIFVNNHKLDADLDNEKTIGDIVLGVNNWVESNQKYVVSCFVDGNDYDLSVMEDLDIEKIGRIDFIIGEEMDVLVSSLEELDRYVDTIGSTLIGRDSLTENESRDLSEGIIWIDTVVTSAKKLLKLNLDTIRPMGKGKNVLEILENLHKSVSHLETVTKIESFLEDLRDLKLFILDLRNRTEILDLNKDQLLEILKDYTTSMDAIKTNFMKVNENFQSGRDKLASEMLTDGIGKMNTLLTALISLRNSHPQLELEKIEIESENLSSYNKNLNECLTQIAIGLENNDLVEVGDILEYELPDLLDGLKPYLDKIIEKLEKVAI
jgi:phage host-nuclease inhibitor protein Gam